MHYVWNKLWKGLVAVVPVALTIYLVYWSGVLIERGLRPVISVFVPERYYWPGMGLLAGLVILFFIGLALNAWLVRRLFQFADDLLEHIPLIKSVYTALRDFMSYLSGAQQHPNVQQVVMVTVGSARLLGFRTAEHVRDLPELPSSEDIAAVYLPMSYQIGGFTLYLPSSQVVPVDMSVEDAMRRVLTAELSRSSARRL
ncbi:MAG: DUF502 domain-containing protein [Gammaproteobacteria bacterium]